jgi:hypothetical protein
MRISRLILALLIVAAPVLCAQQAHEGGTAKTPAIASPAQGSPRSKKAPQPEHEALQITIIFRRYRDEKRVTDRSYTLLATTGEVLPAIRDDERYRASMSDDKNFLDHNIDVDILGLKRSGESIYVALRISTQNFALDVPGGPPKLPVIADTHQYLITPTIPIGKLVTVYTASQPLRSQEVQLLVQPMGAPVPVPQ